MNISLSKLLPLLILTLIFPLVFLNGWLAFRVILYFKPLITTFILAGLLAFILNYPVSILQQRGVKRNYAVALVFITTVIIVFALGLTVLPIILQQSHEMVTILPQWIDSSESKLKNINDWILSFGFKVNFHQIFYQIVNRLPDELDYLVDELFTIAIDTIDSISEALITVVLTVYLLLDGARIWDSFFKKLPLSFGQQLRQSIQKNFQNYLIGQVALAFLMGISLTIVFLVLQVQFALLFGLGIGILSLIPFGDVVSLAVVTLIIASHDFWLAARVLAVAVVVDQLIDQAIAPRLLGSFTGLRPIWVLISLLVGTYIGGVLGLLIAVPVAGVIKDALDNWQLPSKPDYSDSVVESKELSEILTNE